jgi:hypothetical protein
MYRVKLKLSMWRPQSRYIRPHQSRKVAKLMYLAFNEVQAGWAEPRVFWETLRSQLFNTTTRTLQGRLRRAAE